MSACGTSLGVRGMLGTKHLFTADSGHGILQHTVADDAHQVVWHCFQERVGRVAEGFFTFRKRVIRGSHDAAL